MVIPKYLHPIKVLLAFDGSPACLAGMNLLNYLRLPAGSQITLLRVAPSQSNTPDLPSIPHAQQKNPTLNWSIFTTDEIVEGDPAEQIIQIADKQNYDLIALGATGQRGLLGILLGSIAQQVAEGANRPVLVARPPGSRLQRIVLASDGSQNSLQAAEYLGLFPLPFGCQVTVLYVMPTLPAAEEAHLIRPSRIAPNRGALLEFEARSQFRSLQEAEHSKGENALRATLQSLSHNLFGRPHGIQIYSALREGDPTEEILSLSREIEADLIVTGSRGLSQVKGWLMGSVSRRLVQHAPCSILIVRGFLTSGGPQHN